MRLSARRAAWLAACLGLLACPWRAFATADRFSHSATLLPDGSVLFAGGQTLVVGPISSIEVIPANSTVPVVAGNLTVNRSSHTATLLPNGKILIAGGYDGATIRGDAQLIDSITHLPGAVIAGMTPRQDHTATLLSNGSVLLCGGFTTAGVASGTCDIFTPNGSGGGSFSAAAVTLLAARADHTATLLNDGRVFLTGGQNPANAPPYNFLASSELYTPGQTVTASASPLRSSRAYHQSTMMANGQILIAGGFNGVNIATSSVGTLVMNYGFLNSAEIYDPASDSILPGIAPMQERRAFQGNQLQPDGTVLSWGGLGNFAPQTLGSQLLGLSNAIATGTVASASTDTITTGAGSIVLSLQVSPQVAGTISSGTVYLYSPTVTLPNGGGSVILTAGDPLNAPSSGLQASLKGAPITCTNSTTCGFINASIPLSGFGGTYNLSPISQTLADGTIAPASGSQICFSNGPLKATNSGLAVGGASQLVTGTALTLTFPSYLAGASVQAGTITLTAGQIVQLSSFTVTLTGGAAGIAAGSVIGAGGTLTIPAPVWTNLTGTIAWAGVDTNQQFNSCITIPVAGSNPPTDTLQQTKATIAFNANQINLSGLNLAIGSATVVVQSMAASDGECYSRKTNTWSYNCTSRVGGYEGFMQTVTLRPNGDTLLFGGETVDVITGNPILSTHTATNIDSFIGGSQGAIAWNSGPAMSVSRANFTATPLPSGKILLTGGTSGTNVLTATDLFDPVANQISPTGPLNLPRDLHSATLLPNGRVLVAGGFVQTAQSTGATNTAEIYYPDTGVWLQTTPMISTRDTHVTVPLPDGTVLVAGGFSNGQYLNSAEIFLSTSGVWQPTANNMIAPRALAAASLLPNGNVLITGGVNAGGPLNSTEIYNPVTRTFSAGPNILNARHSHSSTLLPHGDVLIAGGDLGFSETALCERYNLAANKFVQAGSMNTARYGHAVVLLPNGSVASVGGSQVGSGATLTQVETYHENDDRWLSGLPLGKTRGLHAAVLGQNGNIYAFGGFDGLNYLNTSESVYFEGSLDSQAGTSASLRQSSVTALSVQGVGPSLSFDRGNTITAQGSNFLGQTEASGGGAAAGNSGHFQPRMELQAVDGSNGTASQGNGGYILDLSTYIYANLFSNPANWSGTGTALTVQLPSNLAALPYGWYHLRTFNNAVYSNSLLIHAGPALPANPPTNAAGVPNTTSQITWTWKIPAGTFDGFNVYSATSGVFITTISVQGAAGNTETWIETGLTPNTTGQIKIAAYNLSGDGPSLTSPIVYTQPATPTAVAVSSAGSNSIGLTWNANGNQTGTVYEISMSTLNPPSDFAAGDLSISTPVPTLLGLTTTNSLITNLQPSTTYSFRLRAFNGFGTASAFSAIVTMETVAPLNGVQGLRQGPTSIQWTWINPCAGQSPCSFNIYNAATGALIASTGNPVYLWTGLSTNTAYGLQVQAVTGAGPGPLSSPTTVYTDAAGPTALSFPGLGITALSTGGFVAAWGPNGNPLGTRYQIVLTQLGGGAFTTSSTTTALSLGIGSLPAAAAVFDLKARAYNGDGFASDADNPAALVDYTPVNLLAAAPSNLTAASLTPTSVLLNWNTNNNSSSATYQVTYSTDNFADTQTALAFSANVSTAGWLISGLPSGTTYSFEVQAQNLAGVKTAISIPLVVQTSNGGAPPGELAGTANAGFDSVISGTLGNLQQVSLFVPANSFPSNTVVLISSYSVGVAPACPNVPSGTGMGIAITDAPAFQPQKPITVTLSYAPAQLPAPASQAALMRIDPVTGACVSLQTVIDAAHQTLTAQLNHFSIYELGALTPAANVDSALIFPNPFYPSRGNGYVTFNQLPAGAWVRIFTLRGELVYEANTNGSGLLTWPGTNRSGRPAASGVYLVSIELGGDKRIYKLAVER